MPELPEVEILVRHLGRLLPGRAIRRVQIERPKSLRGSTPAQFRRALVAARFVDVSRRGKYLSFALQKPGERQARVLVGHLGMTGRMYLSQAGSKPAKHEVLRMDLGDESFVFDDPRYFGFFTFDTRALDALGPEPLDSRSPPLSFLAALERSRQPIKVKLLDQTVVAGVGNIYACEALFRARLAPQLPSNRLTSAQARTLWQSIRATLQEAIRCGSTLSLNFGDADSKDRMFYFGRERGKSESCEERFKVYDRAGEACLVCGTPVRRIRQAARSTYFCPKCQCTRTRGTPQNRQNRFDAKGTGL